MTSTTTHRHAGAFQHEALFYAGLDDFLAQTAPFVRAGVHADEPVLVALPRQRLEALRDELGEDAGRATFADMEELGANPARIIPAWQDFLSANGGGARRLRGLGEPIWAGRSEAELVESQRHETLLNVAFAESGSWRLLCPYDVATLPPPVIEEARRSHPLVTTAGEPHENDACRSLEEMAQPWGRPLIEPPADAVTFTFGETDLRAVRRLVGQTADRAGLDDGRRNELLLAVHEIASNSVLHAGGWGFLRTWQDGDNVVCEVLDEGRIDQPLVGRQRPDIGATGGRGIWLANQLCDLVQIRTSRSGNAVRLHMHR